MTAARFASALATFIAGCALALVVAYWGWQIVAPAPLHIAAPPPADPVATIGAADLFHGAGAHTTPDAPAAAMLSGDARLVGIVARPGQRGYALFRFPSGAKLVAQGEQISPGVTLTAIEPFAITLRDGAGERRYVLRESSAAAPAAASAAPARTPSPARGASRTASCAPPAGFAGNVVRINAELLGGLSGEAGPWRTLLAPATGGLVVRENGGFSAMLGLQSGDRIAQANGIALRVPDDVTSAVIRPLIANQGVRVVGSRGGTKHELWLANIACAGKS
ncbi:MAG TPA: hypothetical protein VLN42_08720 [Casimicrobiaceae bacterium]|nr:hypothetical protein [Casimicrobiaceae bacterium]